MKCPKCDYLGFETGDRCKNCGYDFSLMTTPAPDLDLRLRDDAASASPVSEPALPLFATADLPDDEPLIRLPAAPRAPLSVRRTPDTPRLRALSRPSRQAPEPSFEFQDDEMPEPVASTSPEPRRHPPSAMAGYAEGATAGHAPILRVPRAARATADSELLPRLTAAVIDHAILLAIDATVLYFTLKMAALTFADWRAVPLVPLIAFLVLLKLSYFSMFTAAGGQTIGKMGSGIRVVGEDGAGVDIMQAVRRSLAGIVSCVTFGLAFVPAILGDGRALHDRVARTRVVALPSA
jgi:uncharacterized RDD family membrane protein YckC